MHEMSNFKLSKESQEIAGHAL